LVINTREFKIRVKGSGPNVIKLFTSVIYEFSE
jgi:hypothetical protein